MCQKPIYYPTRNFQCPAACWFMFSAQFPLCIFFSWIQSSFSLWSNLNFPGWVIVMCLISILFVLFFGFLTIVMEKKKMGSEFVFVLVFPDGIENLECWMSLCGREGVHQGFWFLPWDLRDRVWYGRLVHPSHPLSSDSWRYLLVGMGNISPWSRKAHDPALYYKQQDVQEAPPPPDNQALLVLPSPNPWSNKLDLPIHKKNVLMLDPSL